MPCPGCQATLRVPAGAAAIRCPACKTVITLAVAPAPTPAAIPLPFGAPAASPPPVVPLARALPAVRASEVYDDDPELDRELSDRDKPAKKNSLLDYDDDELDDDQRTEKRRLLRLFEECKAARTGTTLFAYAYGIETLAYFLGFLYLVVAAFGAPILPMTWGAIGLHIIGILVQIAGNVYCCMGPRAARGQAIFALITTILALLTLGVAFIYSLLGNVIVLSGAGLFEGGKQGFGDMSLWVLAPLAPTLEMLSFPVWLASGSWKEGAWLIAIPGIFDLARHTYTAVLLRGYCEEGKSPELGWRISRFMTRVYATFGTLFVMRLIACGIIATNSATRDDQGLLIFLSLTYAGAIATFAVAMVAQAYALMDATEVLDYKRFAMKSGRLDVV